MNERIAYGYLPSFAQALAAMLRAGTALSQALKALSGLQGDGDAGEWREALAALCRDMESGETLLKAMSRSPEVFPALLLCMVRAGEVSSILDRTLTRYADYARKEHALCGGRSPDSLEPALEASLWCRRLHMQLVSGVPIIQSLEASVEPPTSDPLREAVVIARASIREGESIVPSLRDFPEYFPPFVCQLLKLGEETSTLSTAILTAAEYLENTAGLPPAGTGEARVPAPSAPANAEAELLPGAHEALAALADQLGRMADRADPSYPSEAPPAPTEPAEPAGWPQPGQPLTPEEKERSRALAEKGETRGLLGRLTGARGSADEKAAAKAQAKLLGFTFVDLEQLKVNPEAVAVLDRDFARRCGLIAVQKLGQRLFVAMKDPTDVITRDRIAEVTGMQVVAALAAASDVDRAIERHYAVQKLPAAPPARAKDTEDPPTIRVANAIIQQAIKDRASDIHIEPGVQHTRVRLRIDGVLHEVMQLPIYIHPPLLARLKLMAGLSASERRAPQRGLVPIHYAGHDYGLRLQTYPFADGEGIVLHVAARAEPFTTLAGLGMLPEQAAAWERLPRQPCGILVVAGPHGVGRTTTLHTMARLLEREERSVVSLADPVEETLDGVKQVSLDPARGLTYAEGIRGLMRQDPDIILVDDVPDAETAAEVAHAAATGHLLVVGVAATDAAHGMEKLIRLDPERVPGQLIGAAGQRLLRTFCPKCQGEATCTPEDGGAGCRASGYRGRTGVFEVLQVESTEMQRLLHAHASRAALRAGAVGDGMVTLAGAAGEKTRAGLTNEAEVRRVIG